MSDKFHVRLVRIADRSTDHALGHPSKVGRVRYTKTFPTRAAAERELSAWAATGEFERYAPADWTGEVRDGPSPSKAEEEAENARLRNERQQVIVMDGITPRGRVEYR